MENIRAFKSSEQFEQLQHMNQVQHAIITSLQETIKNLQNKVEHLEELLKAIEHLDIKS